MRAVIWGSYDTGKPRTRIMLAALRAAGVETTEIHADVWRGVEDKSQISSVWRKLNIMLMLIAAYPMLIYRYLRAPDHDVVVVGYLGHFDVLVLWAFAKLRGKPIVWDAFLSLYDTVVCDRQLIAPRHPAALILKFLEGAACRAADRVVLDTKAHGALFRDLYGLPEERICSVFVGAELHKFRPQAPTARPDRETTILFYGQFIPLHGIETIVEAAAATRNRPYRWIVIGTGQEAGKIRAKIDMSGAAIDWKQWVPYDALRDHIRNADICLGVFGDSGKAGRVIPNKVFQIAAAGRPLITRDGPGVRELFSPDDAGVFLVPPADPQALIAAIEDWSRRREDVSALGTALHAQARRRFALSALGAEWRVVLSDAASSVQVNHHMAAPRSQ